MPALCNNSFPCSLLCSRIWCWHRHSVPPLGNDTSTAHVETGKKAVVLWASSRVFQQGILVLRMVCEICLFSGRGIQAQTKRTGTLLAHAVNQYHWVMYFTWLVTFIRERGPTCACDTLDQDSGILTRGRHLSRGD